MFLIDSFITEDSTHFIDFSKSTNDQLLWNQIQSISEYTFRYNSGEILIYNSSPNRFPFVTKGHALAPPALEDNTGVSTSMNPFVFKKERM